MWEGLILSKLHCYTDSHMFKKTITKFTAFCVVSLSAGALAIAQSQFPNGISVNGSTLILPNGNIAVGRTDAPNGKIDVLRLVDAVHGGSYRGIQSTAVLHNGTGGFVYGVFGTAMESTSGNWQPTSQHGVVGLAGEGVGYKNGSRTWGASVLASQISGQGDDMAGIEVDVNARSPVLRRYGVSIVAIAGASYAGSEDDVGLRFINKTGGAPWRNGILFTGAGSGADYPLASNATMMGSRGTASILHGINLADGLTITGNAFASPGFVVKGTGNVGIQTNAPAYPLDVNGVIRSGNTGSNSGIVLYDTATNQQFCIRVTNGQVVPTSGPCAGSTTPSPTPVVLPGTLSVNPNGNWITINYSNIIATSTIAFVNNNTGARYNSTQQVFGNGTVTIQVPVSYTHLTLPTSDLV